MNKRKLLRHLRSHGCRFAHEGENHEIWTNADGTRASPVPRHTEIIPYTARGICKDLGVPPPAEK